MLRNPLICWTAAILAEGKFVPEKTEIRGNVAPPPHPTVAGKRTPSSLVGQAEKKAIISDGCGRRGRGLKRPNKIGPFKRLGDSYHNLPWCSRKPCVGLVAQSGTTSGRNKTMKVLNASLWWGLCGTCRHGGDIRTPGFPDLRIDTDQPRMERVRGVDSRQQARGPRELQGHCGEHPQVVG